MNYKEILNESASFLRTNKDNALVNEVFTYPPPAETVSPFVVCFIESVNQEVEEQLGSGDESINVAFRVCVMMPQNAEAGRIQTNESLYDAVSNVRDVTRMQEFDEHLRTQFPNDQIRTVGYGIDFGTTDIGDSNLLTGTLTVEVVRFVD